MFYLMIILAVIFTVLVLHFIYNKTKSIKFISSFELVDNILYKDKIPYADTIRVNEIGGIRAYFDFVEGKLHCISLYMKDGANVYWRVGNKYTVCYDREGHSVSQGRFETLYDRLVDANSLLEIFNRNFEQCQLSI